MPQSLALIALIIRDYDEAIGWFITKLGFTLVADEPQPEQNKRWVLVAPATTPRPSSSLRRFPAVLRLAENLGGSVRPTAKSYLLPK